MVSEGAVGTATMISCQIDARRAIREIRASVAERYRDMTQAELSDELARRGLPTGGHVDELRERLVDSDFAC